MSLVVPSSLKAADIARFAHRAGQLEKARPAVAYWCNYWIVQEIIAKGLHQADEESKAYTLHLMDKLEQTKVDFADNDAIVDDIAGQAYIEQFGQETFQRAENAMKADKVTRQTADTFQAAATFFELCQIWGPLDAEIASKIKFAKYHALRIAKAIKAGDDPNDSNPKTEVVENDEGGDPDQPLDLSGSTSAPQNRQPSIEDVPDQSHAADVALPQPTSLSMENYYQSPPAGDVSPLAPSEQGDKAPEHRDYFTNANAGSTSDGVSPIDAPPHAGAPWQAPSHANQSPYVAPAANPVVPQHPPRESSRAPPPANGVAGVPARPAFASPPPAPVSAPPSQVPNASFRVDEDSVIAAQKHAKFAISALNFEDVSTAVKELREALVSLGAGV